MKIDLVAGRGVGAVGALFSAVDGGQRLWETSGLWAAAGIGELYGWRRSLQVAGWSLFSVLLILLAPLTLLAAALFVYPVGFGLAVAGLQAGQSLVAAYERLLGVAFEPAGLPTLLPRLVMVPLVVTILALLSGQYRRRRGLRRRAQGARWWRAFGVPLDSLGAVRRFGGGLWALIRGAAASQESPAVDLGHRYSDLLIENLGQPGFRELLVVAHDLDARRDLVFALLSEPYRGRILLGRRDRTREAEVVDLGEQGQAHAMDALAACLSVPVATEPHLMRFGAETYWRGETHRVCDRPEATGRLLAEVANAGVEQMIVVTASARLGGPHGLGPEPLDPRQRAGEYLVAAETATLRDAMTSQGHRFRQVFRIQPVHNAVGPFDFWGRYDERSDRIQTVRELIDRGYDDACRQFVEPIFGASGERLARKTPETRP